MVDNIKNEEYGTRIIDTVYVSSVGFNPEALSELERLMATRVEEPEDKLNFKTVNFENDIYSVIQC